MEDSRFYVMDLDATNLNDLSSWIVSDSLVGIVDEEAGGIILYCHRDKAAEIMAKLEV